METSATVVLFLSLLAVSYTYIGYPLVLFLVARFSRDIPNERNYVPNDVDCFPTVTVYIAAHNEDRHIRAKIENALELEYEGSLSIVVADDGSSDRTASIASEFQDRSVSLFRSEDNIGKTAMQNTVIPKLESDLVFFSDATSIWPIDTVKVLSAEFLDASVGCVTVDVKLQSTETDTGDDHQSSWWKYERLIRQLGTDAGTTIVASGTCYAIRRELFSSLPNEIAEDLGTPLSIAKAGFRVVQNTDVTVTDFGPQTTGDEWSMRKRVALQNITAAFCFAELLLPRYGIASFQFWSHKIARIVSWVFLVTFSMSAVILYRTPPYDSLLYVVILGALLATLGVCFPSLRKNCRVCSLMSSFLVLNLAYAVSSFNYARGHRLAAWSTARH